MLKTDVKQTNLKLGLLSIVSLQNFCFSLLLGSELQLIVEIMMKCRACPSKWPQNK